MDTITTIQNLLTWNGSARPAMVELTQNEIRLIAAAPELLEALKAVVAVADRRTVEFDKARAAIAKAEPRSNKEEAA